MIGPPRYPWGNGRQQINGQRMSEYSSTDARIDWFAGQDGTRLCLHIIGEGRPLVLLHGLFSSAFVNWIKFGTAAHLAKRSEEHTSELQSLMRISYAVFCLKKKKHKIYIHIQ